MQQRWGHHVGGTIGLPIELCLGGASACLDREALARIPSLTQRMLTVGLWCVYKPLFFVLWAVSIVGMVSYFWLYVGLLHATAIASGVSRGACLPNALRARGYVSQTAEAGSWTEDPWFAYMHIPVFVAVVPPLFVPLAVRFLVGDGYLTAVALTWSDRHAAQYFTHLLSLTNHTMTAMLDQAFALIQLVNTIL